ncbi:MAG: hypothetical protein PVG00_01435 [Desulfobacterales bacterium]
MLLLPPPPEQALKRAKVMKTATINPIKPFLKKQPGSFHTDVDWYRALKHRNLACIIFKPPVLFYGTDETGIFAA